MTLNLLVLVTAICCLCQLVILKCDLPSDFWCDHAGIAAECGTERYCATYRKNMRNRPFDVKVFLDGNALDSQRFVTEKLYPNLVAHPKRVSVSIYPITLTDRSKKVAKCVPDDAKCNLNKLLSCATHYLSGDKLYHFVFCIELGLKFNRTVEESERSCYRDVTSGREQDMIKHCVKSSEGISKQASDEKMAHMLRPARQRFLPWISINDKSLDEMQAYQSMLKTKLLIWYKVLNKETNRSVVPTSSRCTMPPDFWCDSTEITNECFDSRKCALYKSYARGRPIQLTLLYATHCPFSQATIVDNFYENLWKNRTLRRFFKIRFLPYGNGKVDDDGKITCQHGPAECVGNMMHDCVKAKTGYEETVEYIVCHMRDVREYRNDHAAFETCSRKMGWSSTKKRSIMNCANSDEGHKLQLKTARESESLEPELKHFAPWLVINGYSTLEMQYHTVDLDKFICRWYYEGNGQRNKCNLCDYAPSQCK